MRERERERERERRERERERERERVSSCCLLKYYDCSYPQLYTTSWQVMGGLGIRCFRATGRHGQGKVRPAISGFLPISPQ